MKTVEAFADEVEILVGNQGLHCTPALRALIAARDAEVKAAALAPREHGSNAYAALKRDIELMVCECREKPEGYMWLASTIGNALQCALRRAEGEPCPCTVCRYRTGAAL